MDDLNRAVEVAGMAVDATLTLTNEPQRLVKCALYHENYGSDHRGTLSEWDMWLETRPESRIERHVRHLLSWL